MSYSNATVTINSVVFYAIVILGSMYIWRTSKREDEKGSFIKLIGYSLLSSFKFSFNNFPIPLGFIIAYFIRVNSQVNMEAKKKAIILGVVLFGLGLLPLNNYLENFLYPRNSIETYLSEERSHEQGFNFTLAKDKTGTILGIYTHTNDIGEKFYNALAGIANINNIPSTVEWKYQINFVQDTNDERFHQLDFDVSADGKFLQLIFEDRYYYFMSDIEFQHAFIEIVDGASKTDLIE